VLKVTAVRGKSVSKRGKVEGEALVTDNLIAFWGGTDWETGEIVEVAHPLRGENVRDKVLVFQAGKGGSGESIGYYYLYKSGNAPKALICNKAQPTTVTSALLCNTPMVYGFEENVVELVANGDTVKVDSDTGEVEVIKKSASST
jgi:predicted aconitase with swiveling domain